MHAPAFAARGSVFANIRRTLRFFDRRNVTHPDRQWTSASGDSLTGHKASYSELDARSGKLSPGEGTSALSPDCHPPWDGGVALSDHMAAAHRYS